LDDSAPGPLRWIEDFVNTRSVELGTEDVGDPGALVDWLRERDLVPEGTRLTAAEHRRALRFREGLRALIATNAGIVPDTDEDSGEGLDPTALADLADIARDLPLVVDVTVMPPELVPHGTKPVDQALARLLAGVVESVAAGTWPRFKVCRQPYCRWAYYDHSRNRSRAWCDMSTCGNRAKARAFRRRQT
jgi:predicted RNA-binding Zn ribbon-like protein